MPSEKKHKKHKSENKALSSNEPLKPLTHYVGDRLELTKHLFSCLKNKQIKQRLPANLQNKSIERIQQICLDEILGISTKRLVSIISNTQCPDNTDSDDSEIEQVDEHISLEEISSDSESEQAKLKAKTEQKKTAAAKDSKKPPKTKKEMTMLELLELQARARAIRSQLALEPVTKIELDSDDEDNNGAVEDKTNSNSNDVPSTSKNVANDKGKETAAAAAKKTESAKKVSEKAINVLSVKIVAPPPPPKSKPVKLKRNYKSQNSENASSSVAVAKKEPSPTKSLEATKKAEDFEDDRDDDVINMDPSPETFFISDSDDDEPPAKKTPEKKEIDKPAVVETPKSPEAKKVEEPQEPEEGECSNDEKSSREASPESEESIEKVSENIQNPQKECSPVKETASDEVMNDEDVVHLMSDTEIELDHQDDEEVERLPKEKSLIPEPPVKKDSPVHRSTVQSDDDVVEINNSSDDEMMNESDDKSAGEPSKPSQTWEERWLSSSKTQKVLKTTQLASKVRVNMLKTKKSQKANEKKKNENDKAMKEKVLNLEEGSMEQFKKIKDNSNSSVN